LTELQRAKLQIAGKGDIKRFFDRAEEGRREFKLNKVEPRDAVAALRRLKPLSDAYDDGPFGDGSLFAKTLDRINDDRASTD
jgi:hypothetical protein